MAHDHAVLVLQGGGALGAFQAGVYEPRMVYAVSDHGAYWVGPALAFRRSAGWFQLTPTLWLDQ